MSEDFLHFVWKMKLFESEGLTTRSGDPVKIENPGVHNDNAGPDFLSGIVLIGSEKWVGNIEIHNRASEWVQHRHHEDEAYDNVVLHVVFENDLEIVNSKGGTIPTVELKDRINPGAFRKYNEIKQSDHWVPCADEISGVGSVVIDQTMESMLINRLKRKTSEINQLLNLTTGNIEEAFYRTLARNMGFRVNAVPFSILAASVDYKTLEKNSFNPFLVEAILFGVAGFLEGNLQDPYATQLQKEFYHQKKKYNLEPIPVSMWKLSRMRPNNFPTRRIAQFSALLSREKRIYSRIINTLSVEEIRAVFNDVEPHPYWKNHYRFDKSSTEISAKLGNTAVDNILINTVAPFLFIHGQLNDNQDYKNRAVELLQSVRAENNGIIRKWKEIGISARSAAESQALIQLKNDMCTHKKCVSCAIGTSLILQEV